MSEAEMIKDNKKCRDMMSPAINRIKRGLDILGSITGMIVFSPLFLLIYLVIKIENGGKVIFSQERIGYQGKPFILYKFRSMKESAEADGKPALCCQGDKRLTRVGRFLREHHLDELPQLWNVLKGDMSFVGPRPLISSEIRAHRLRLEYGVYRFRPGLTGWAQINGRDDISLMKKMKLDKEYCDKWSLKLDLIILLRSIGVVVKREGYQEGAIHRR